MIASSSRLALVIPLAAVNTVGYLVANEYPLFARNHLPLTPVDRAIPFLVWTVWPYAMLLLSDIVLPFLVRDRALFSRMLVAYGVAIGTNFLIWSLFPTVIARPDLPSGDSLSEAAYRLLIAIDRAGNCFPSGHVTIPSVGVWALSCEWRRHRVALWIVLALFSLSILTTKQHYVADLLAGFATAMLGIAVSGWLTGRRPFSHA
jgi:membrane-associated phospholipid phosphatase